LLKMLVGEPVSRITPGSTRGFAIMLSRNSVAATVENTISLFSVISEMALLEYWSTL
jgi:hypothetical protein